jgi:hypothetical protein
LSLIEARVHRKQGLKMEKFPIFYLSGRHGTDAKIETEWIKRTGCKFRCFSYVYVAPGAFYWRPRMESAYHASVENKCRIAMDSGAFSFHKFVSGGLGATSGRMMAKSNSMRKLGNVEAFREKTIEEYVQYVKENRQDWDFYFTFDYVKHAPTVYKITKSLERQGIRPTPVFHGDEGLDWLKRYIDEGHKLVGIGSADKARRTWKDKRYYFDQVFNLTEKHGVMCHGLAITSLSLTFSYPWYSVDSSTWARISGFGHIIVLDPATRTAGQVHVSTRESTGNLKSYNRMPKHIQKEIQRQVEEHGFDFHKVRSNLDERSTYNGWMFCNMAKLDLRKGEDKIQWERLL